MPEQFLKKFDKQAAAGALKDAEVLLTFITDVGGGEFEPNCAWSALENMRRDLSALVSGDHDYDYLEQAYLNCLLAQVAGGQLTQLARVADSFIKLLPTGGVLPSADKVAALTPEWQKLRAQLDLTEAGARRLALIMDGLDEERARQATGQLTNLVFYYSAFKERSVPLLAALLYIESDDAAAMDADKLDEFLERLANQEPNKQADEWVTTLRFLGQSFFGRNARVGQWAVDTIMEMPLERRVIGSDADFAFFTVALMLSLRVISGEYNELRCAWAGKTVWPAICFNLPVAQTLSEVLSGAPRLIDYINWSVDFSDQMLNNERPLFFLSEGDNTTVKDFLSRYNAAAGKKTEAAGGFARQQLVDDLINERHWPLRSKPHILNLLEIFVNLRDCNLIDYQGILSDDGVKERKNWRALLSRDLTKEEYEEIKEYFRLIARPARLKMEIIGSMATLPWRQEPYLKRALLLNQAYEEIYFPHYQSLIFFDELSGQWQFNENWPSPLLPPGEIAPLPATDKTS